MHAHADSPVLLPVAHDAMPVMGWMAGADWSVEGLSCRMSDLQGKENIRVRGETSK
jgi:hypothetical protein